MMEEIDDLLDQIANRKWGITELNFKIKALKNQKLLISNIEDASIGSAPWYKGFRIVAGGQTFSIRLPRFNMENGQKTNLMCAPVIEKVGKIDRETSLEICQLLRKTLD